MSLVTGPFSLDRSGECRGESPQRLWRFRPLTAAKIAYAVAGGNAIALWVSRVDESAVRNTQDVDILLRCADLERAKDAMQKAGFVYHRVAGIDAFLDEPHGKARNAVHIIFANEKVRATEAFVNPDVSESEAGDRFRVLSLQALVQIKLTAFRDKDRVHLRT